MYLLLDTDIGDDIDDFLTIGLILKKDLNLVGVTTVYREANARASIVKNFFEYAGRNDIPVYAGYSQPISAQSNVFSLNVYAQQVVSVIAVILLAVLIIYLNLVVRKIENKK